MITVRAIQDATCAHYGLSHQDLVSDKRARRYARPRQVAMYLARNLTSRSLPVVGRCFGDRDHSTVIHAERVIDSLRREDPEIAAAIVCITSAARTGLGPVDEALTGWMA